ncbi:myosin light polypeptide 6 isoform X2 [Sigmodon hispidus]
MELQETSDHLSCPQGPPVAPTPSIEGLESLLLPPDDFQQENEQEREGREELVHWIGAFGDGKILYSQCGDVMRALGRNLTNAEVLKILENPKSDEMNVKVLDFEHFLSMLQTVAKNKDQGLCVFDQEGSSTIMGAEIHHVLVILGEEMMEEGVEMLVAGHKDSSGCINYEELVRMVLNG